MLQLSLILYVHDVFRMDIFLMKETDGKDIFSRTASFITFILIVAQSPSILSQNSKISGFNRLFTSFHDHI